jgi:hypothetical protein
VEWLTPPGGYPPLWKAAEQTCLDEVKDLLAAAGGWTARVLEVYAPAAREPAPVRAGVNGRLTTLDGRELPPGEAALGAALQAGNCLAHAGRSARWNGRRPAGYARGKRFLRLGGSYSAEAKVRIRTITGGRGLIYPLAGRDERLNYPARVLGRAAYSDPHPPLPKIIS